MESLHMLRPIMNCWSRVYPTMHTYMKRKHSNKKNEEGKVVNVDGLKLSPELILDYAMPYYAGVHINIANMK